ncbi:MAG TPA: nucleotidyltransferase domain-containing protein [Usitatibacteraceae bacterium]|nr:nucleotidyltransferase domain-containing protein [Usitatibacteraceae bacterium]
MNTPAPATLPPDVERLLQQFCDATRAAFGEDLLSIVLFGSAAEGRMRATSDVNVIVVVAKFDKDAADRLRDALRFARAAIDLNPMFVLESEIGAAMESFSVKFADIAHRHRVLFGKNPFADIVLPREALVLRLKQVLLNMQIRARERYIVLSLREEQLVRYLAESAGPLRAAAASLLQLEGTPAESPKAALERVVGDFADPALQQVLVALSTARETQALEPGTAAPVAIAVMRLIGRLRERVEKLA